MVFQITDPILFEESLTETMQQVRREIQCIRINEYKFVYFQINTKQMVGY